MVENMARFSSSFDFDHKYLRNIPTKQKSEKHLINYGPIHWQTELRSNVHPIDSNADEAQQQPVKFRLASSRPAVIPLAAHSIQ